ncbi:LacI family DNA-binding transcriptional regulator, partial [Candidatus Caldatribacterium sp.]|uniref:LacI family DNA-binding transcriptional regulator n=1 Tax=Candidatus Caldatribacterium sp. TaxID=2282143 RepID=UPI0029914A7F|nr:LacI family DNA-binding transcriptional regulator [Candidatus Caldatribacterium sp.]MDW8081321.1 LacI family DNA-binding transcriptional regulator [Candidatus Calescibacterium sp.]
MTSRKRPTIKDIARLSGFSVGTVDRALHGRPGIHPETRRKILAVARELGYETNQVASVLSRNTSVVLAAIFPRELHYFYDDVRRGFSDAVAQLRDFRVLPYVREVEALGRGEEEILEELLQEDISGLILVPGHRSRLNTYIDRFAERGVPTVTVSTDAPGSRRLSAVYVDPRKNGELAGELMARFLRGEGSVAVMVGSLEIEDHLQKVQGFSASWERLTGKKVFHVFENEEREDLAYENALLALRTIPDLRGMYVATANSPAVCQALEEWGCSGGIVVVATDLFATMVPYLAKGVIQATIFQNPYRQGFEAVMLLFRFLLGGVTPPVCRYLEPIVVMQSNLTFYLSKEGEG